MKNNVAGISEIVERLSKLANHKYDEREMRFKSAADIPEDLWPCISKIEFTTAGTKKEIRIKLYNKKRAQNLLRKILKKADWHG